MWDFARFWNHLSVLVLDFLMLGQNWTRHFGRESVGLWGVPGQGRRLAWLCSTSLPEGHCLQGHGGCGNHLWRLTVYHVPPLELGGVWVFWLLVCLFCCWWVYSGVFMGDLFVIIIFNLYLFCFIISRNPSVPVCSHIWGERRWKLVQRSCNITAELSGQVSCHRKWGRAQVGGGGGDGQRCPSCAGPWGIVFPLVLFSLGYPDQCQLHNAVITSSKGHWNLHLQSSKLSNYLYKCWRLDKGAGEGNNSLSLSSF